MKLTYYFDIVCPWCVIGKKYLTTALQQWKRETGEDITVEYRSFLLDPSIPKTGLPFKETMIKKKGASPEMLEQMFCMVEDAGQQAGLCFDFSKVSKMPYVQYAHQLIALTPQEHKSTLIDAITDAYFQGDKDIGDLDILRDLAKKTGLEESLIDEIAEGAGWDKVQVDLQEAYNLYIQGVPFLVINDTYAVSGARKSEELIQLFKKL